MSSKTPWPFLSFKLIVTFPPPVRYLGHTLVDQASGEEATSGAIRTIIAMAKKQDKKLERVALTISLRGVRVVQINTGETHIDFSIYRVSYCSADITYDHVFAFIATAHNSSLECHAFLCPKRKVAQAATLTIAQVNMAASASSHNSPGLQLGLQVLANGPGEEEEEAGRGEGVEVQL